MATSDNRSAATGMDAQTTAGDAKLQAGIAAAFASGAELAPQVQALQQALLSSIAAGQRREAARLTARYGAGDPRIAAAGARAAQFDELGAQWSAGAKTASRLALTVQQDGLFHGYVTQADGSPAVGYVVQLLIKAAGVENRKPEAAQTDATGYFGIDVAAAYPKLFSGASAANHWLARLVALASDPSNVTGQPATAAAAAGGKAAAIESAVQVVNRDGRTVLEDPMPPVFEGGMSEYRDYVLGSGPVLKSTVG